MIADFTLSEVEKSDILLLLRASPYHMGRVYVEEFLLYWIQPKSPIFLTRAFTYYSLLITHYSLLITPLPQLLEQQTNFI